MNTPLATMKEALEAAKHPKGPCAVPCPHCDASTILRAHGIAWLAELIAEVERLETELTVTNEFLTGAETEAVNYERLWREAASAARGEG